MPDPSLPPNGAPGPDTAAQGQALAGQQAPPAPAPAPSPFVGLGGLSGPSQTLAQRISTQAPAPAPAPAAPQGYDPNHFEPMPIQRANGTTDHMLRQKDTNMVYVNAADSPQLASALSPVKPGEAPKSGWYNVANGDFSKKANYQLVPDYDPQKVIAAKTAAAAPQKSLGGRLWDAIQSDPVDRTVANAVLSGGDSLINTITPNGGITNPMHWNALDKALTQYQAEGGKGTSSDFLAWAQKKNLTPGANGAAGALAGGGAMPVDAFKATLDSIAQGQPGKTLNLNQQTIPYIQDALQRAQHLSASTENQQNFPNGSALSAAFSQKRAEEAASMHQQLQGMKVATDPAEIAQRQQAMVRNLQAQGLTGDALTTAAQKLAPYAAFEDPQAAHDTLQSLKQAGFQSEALGQGTILDPNAPGQPAEKLAKSNAGQVGRFLPSMLPLAIPGIGEIDALNVGSNASKLVKALSFGGRLGVSSAEAAAKLTAGSAVDTLQHTDPDNYSNALLNNFGQNAKFGLGVGLASPIAQKALSVAGGAALSVVNPVTQKLIGYTIPGFRAIGGAGRPLTGALTGMGVGMGVDVLSRLHNGETWDDIKKTMPVTAAQFAVMEGITAANTYKAENGAVKDATGPGGMLGKNQPDHEFMEGYENPEAALKSMGHTLQGATAYKATLDAQVERLKQDIQNLKQPSPGGNAAAQDATVSIEQKQAQLKALTEHAASVGDTITKLTKAMPAVHMLAERGYTWNASGYSPMDAVKDRVKAAQNAAAGKANSPEGAQAMGQAPKAPLVEPPAPAEEPATEKAPMPPKAEKAEAPAAEAPKKLSDLSQQEKFAILKEAREKGVPPPEGLFKTPEELKAELDALPKPTVKPMSAAETADRDLLRKLHNRIGRGQAPEDALEGSDLEDYNQLRDIYGEPSDRRLRPRGKDIPPPAAAAPKAAMPEPQVEEAPVPKPTLAKKRVMEEGNPLTRALLRASAQPTSDESPLIAAARRGGAMPFKIGQEGLAPDTETAAQGGEMPFDPRGVQDPARVEERGQTLESLFPGETAAPASGELPNIGSKRPGKAVEVTPSQAAKNALSAFSKKQAGTYRPAGTREELPPAEQAKGQVTQALGRTAQFLADAAKQGGDQKTSERLADATNKFFDPKRLEEGDTAPRQRPLSEQVLGLDHPQTSATIEAALKHVEPGKARALRALIRAADPQAIPNDMAQGVIHPQLAADVFNYRRLVARALDEAQTTTDSARLKELVDAVQKHRFALGLKDGPGLSSVFDPEARNPLSETKPAMTAAARREALTADTTSQANRIHGVFGEEGHDRGAALLEGHRLGQEREGKEFFSRLRASEDNPRGLDHAQRQTIFEREVDRAGVDPEKARADMAEKGVWEGPRFDFVKPADEPASAPPLPVPGHQHAHTIMGLRGPEPEAGNPIQEREAPITRYSTGLFVSHLNHELRESGEKERVRLQPKPVPEPVPLRSAEDRATGMDVMNRMGLTPEDEERVKAARAVQDAGSREGVQGVYQSYIQALKGEHDEMADDHPDKQATANEIERATEEAGKNPDRVDPSTMGVLNSHFASHRYAFIRDLERRAIMGTPEDIETAHHIFERLGLPVLTDQQVAEARERGLLGEEHLHLDPLTATELMGAKTSEERAGDTGPGKLNRPKEGMSRAEGEMTKDPFGPGEAGALARGHEEVAETLNRQTRDEVEAGEAGLSRHLAGGDLRGRTAESKAHTSLQGMASELVRRGLLNPMAEGEYHEMPISHDQIIGKHVNHLMGTLDKLRDSQTPALTRLAKRAERAITAERVAQLGPSHGLRAAVNSEVRTQPETPGSDKMVQTVHYRTTSLGGVPAETKAWIAKRTAQAHRDALRRVLESPDEREIRETAGEAAGNRANELYSRLRALAGQRTLSAESKQEARDLFRGAGAGAELLRDPNLSPEAREKLVALQGAVERGGLQKALGESGTAPDSMLDDLRAAKTPEEAKAVREGYSNLLGSLRESDKAVRENPKSNLEKAADWIVNQAQANGHEFDLGKSIPLPNGGSLSPISQSALLNPAANRHGEAVERVLNGAEGGEESSLDQPMNEEGLTLGHLLGAPDEGFEEHPEGESGGTTLDAQMNAHITDADQREAEARTEAQMKAAFGPVYGAKIVDPLSAAEATIGNLHDILGERGEELTAQGNQGLLRDQVLKEWQKRGHTGMIQEYQDNLKRALDTVNRVLGKTPNSSKDVQEMARLTAETLRALPPHMVNALKLREATPEELKALFPDAEEAPAGAYDARVNDTRLGDSLAADTVHIQKNLHALFEGRGMPDADARKLAWGVLHHELTHWIETYQMGQEGYGDRMTAAFADDAHRQLGAMGYGWASDLLRSEVPGGGSTGDAMGLLAGSPDGKVAFHAEDGEGAAAKLKGLDPSQFTTKTDAKGGIEVTDKRLGKRVASYRPEGKGGSVRLYFQDPSFRALTNASEWHAETMRNAYQSILDGRLTKGLREMPTSLVDNLVQMAGDHAGLIQGALDGGGRSEGLKEVLTNMADAMSTGRGLSKPAFPGHESRGTAAYGTPGSPMSFSAFHSLQSFNDQGRGGGVMPFNLLDPGDPATRSAFSVGASMGDVAGKLAHRAWSRIKTSGEQFAQIPKDALEAATREDPNAPGTRLGRLIKNLNMGTRPEGMAGNALYDMQREIARNQARSSAASEALIAPRAAMEDILNKTTRLPEYVHSVRAEMAKGDGANVESLTPHGTLLAVHHQDHLGNPTTTIVIPRQDGAAPRSEDMRPEVAIHLFNAMTGDNGALSILPKNLREAVQRATPTLTEVARDYTDEMVHNGQDERGIRNMLNANGTYATALIDNLHPSLKASSIADPVNPDEMSPDAALSDKANPADLKQPLRFNFDNPVDAFHAGHQRMAVVTAFGKGLSVHMPMGVIEHGHAAGPDMMPMRNIPAYLKGRGWGLFGEHNTSIPLNPETQSRDFSKAEPFIHKSLWPVYNRLFGQSMRGNIAIDPLMKAKASLNQVHYFGPFHFGTAGFLSKAAETSRVLSESLAALHGTVTRNAQAIDGASEAEASSRASRVVEAAHDMLKTGKTGQRINDLYQQHGGRSDAEILSEPTMTPAEKATMLGMRAANWTPRADPYFEDLRHSLLQGAIAKTGIHDIDGFRDWINKPLLGFGDVAAKGFGRVADVVNQNLFQKFVMNRKAAVMHEFMGDAFRKAGYSVESPKDLQRLAADLRNNTGGIAETAHETVSRADDLLGMASTKRTLADPRMGQVYNALSSAFMWHLGTNRSIVKSLHDSLLATPGAGKAYRAGFSKITGIEPKQQVNLRQSLGSFAGQMVLMGMIGQVMQSAGLARTKRWAFNPAGEATDEFFHFLSDRLYPTMGIESAQGGLPPRRTLGYMGNVHDAFTNPLAYAKKEAVGGLNPVFGAGLQAANDVAGVRPMGNPKDIPLLSPTTRQNLLEAETPREDDDEMTRFGRFMVRGAGQVAVEGTPYNSRASSVRPDMTPAQKALTTFGLRSEIFHDETPEEDMTDAEKKESNANLKANGAFSGPRLPKSGVDAEGRRFVVPPHPKYGK